MENEDLSMIEVVADEVGSPRNDNTAGSALYPVPIRLNRAASANEAQLLRGIWDHPPQFSTMHRPGILRVAGERIILDGTTIEEVERYHAATLRLVLAEVNTRITEQGVKKKAQVQSNAEQEEAHRANVADVARRIDLA